MDQTFIRPATADEVPALKAIVDGAYEHYIERIGRKPAPMTDDYTALVGAGRIWVLAVQGDIAGLIDLSFQPDHLLVGNVAVARSHQGHGFGRDLLNHAETCARNAGITQLRLYTNALMHENLTIYRRLGWQEYDRAEVDGFKRVFMRKTLTYAASPA